MKLRHFLTSAAASALLFAPTAQAADHIIMSGEDASGALAQDYHPLDSAIGNHSTIPVNDTITWKTHSGTTFNSAGGTMDDHPLEADPVPGNTFPPSFGIDSMTATEYQYRFTSPGQYYYRCALHNAMHGEITVTPGEAPKALIGAASTSTKVGNVLFFSADNSQAFNGKTVASYDWSAPSTASPSSSSGSTYVVGFSQPGQQTVTLKVTDSAGVTNETSIVVDVQPQATTSNGGGGGTSDNPLPSVDLGSTPFIPTIGVILKKKKIKIGYSVSGVGKTSVKAIFRSKNKIVASGSGSTNIPAKDGNTVGQINAVLTKAGKKILRGKSAVILKLTLTMKDSKGQTASTRKNVQVFQTHTAVVTTP